MEHKVEKKYKDKLFRLIFKEKDKLLSLYNAVNKSNYTNPDDLEIVTLENAVYMNMKNDLAFVIEDRLNIYEHQSTVNLNMPLRNLFYVSKEYQKLVENKSLYSVVLIKVPTPKFVVFYNGTQEQPEQYVLQLSDAYEKITEEIDLELKVMVYNINYGYNAELMEACQTLKEYSIYVEKVRSYIKAMPLEEAVDRAIDECIKENILRDFLVKYRAEAREMCIFEYDEEYELAKLKRMEREDERAYVLREIEKIKKLEREDEREIVLREIEEIKKMEREDEREIILREIEEIKKLEREDEREIVLREIEEIKKLEREDEREIVLREIEEIKKLEREDEREIILREIEEIKKLEREDEREIVLREIEEIKKLEREDEREIVLREIEEIKKIEREDAFEESKKIFEMESKKKLINQVYKKILKDKSLEKIADELEEERETIEPIYDTIKAVGEDFNCDLVYGKLHGK